MEDVTNGSESLAVEAAVDVSPETVAANSTPEVKTSPEVKAARQAMDAEKNSSVEKKDQSVKEKPSKKEIPSTKDAPILKEAASSEAPVIPPAYAPTLKYKVNGQEYDFDSELKDLVKSPEVEKKLQELYSNAHGIGYVREKADKFLNDYKEVSKKYSDIDRDLRLLSHHVQNDDWDSFFGDLKISDKKIFEWVERKLAQMNMDPYQQAQIEKQRQPQRQSFLTQEENQSYKTQAQETARMARSYELEMELIKPEVSSIAQEFDAKVGRPGAFKEECINRGALAWQFAKKDIPAAEAVGQAMSIFGKVLTPAQKAEVTQTLTAAPKAPLPIIPNVASRQTSPVKQAPKTTDDLRRMY